MAFEQFAKKGEKNVFSGLFGGNDSDAEEDGSSTADDEETAHDTGDEKDICKSDITDAVTQPYFYKSQNSAVEINLQEKKQDGIAHQVWPAAEFLSSEWEKHRNGKWLKYFGLDDHSCSGEHVDIVELGAGVGLCGMFMAALPGPPTIGKVVVTDLPEALEGLNANIALNSSRFNCAVEAGVLAWGEVDHVESILKLFGGRIPKVIVAADCIYWESLFAPLCSTLVTLTGMGCHVLLAHVKRWKRDQKFFKMCTKNKLIVELLEEKIVVEPAVHTGLPEKKVMRIYHVCSPVYHSSSTTTTTTTTIGATRIDSAKNSKSEEERA